MGGCFGGVIGGYFGGIIWRDILGGFWGGNLADVWGDNWGVFKANWFCAFLKLLGRDPRPVEGPSRAA